MSRILCFRKDCKHLCEISEECTREITAINSEGICKHYHPKDGKPNPEILKG